MRVLLLNQYYHPDVAPTAQLAADLGAALAARGHEVRAVACNRPYASVGDPRLPLRERHRGVEIVRVRSTALGRRSHLLRAVDYATFLAGATAPVLASARPDVVVALSTPPLVATLGLLARLVRGARLVLWVMDVYPDVAVQLGALAAGGLAARALRRLAGTLLDRADAVVALDEAMRDRLIAGGAAPSKIEVIDNWCDGDAIRPAPAAANPLRHRLGLDGVFTVSYSGNMGHGHDFATVVGAMHLLRDQPVHWLFIGDGPGREALRATMHARSLERVTFLPYVPAAELPVSLTAADASLVTLKAGLAGQLVPSKLYGLLAAGVPILYVGPPEGRCHGVVAGEGVGFALGNGDARGLADAIAALRSDGEARAAMGRRARALYEARFARERALERHHRLLLRVVGEAA
jgi:glycosyltransferase involved in cell wall biosynthesis